MSIQKTLLNETERIPFPAALFGSCFPFQIEPTIYNMASYISDQYQGGYWNMYRLDNSAFYMAPESDEDFTVVCENYFQGTLSPDAFGIAACLYAYSFLSFSKNPTLAELCANQYHWLREYALEHPEASAIMAAID